MVKHPGWLACSAALLIITVGSNGAPVHAQVNVTQAQLKCQDGVNKTLGKFVGSKAKCISKCIATQRKATTPAFAGCMAPYADPTAMACITGNLKGAEAKAGAGIAKVCAALASCPACYTPPTKCSDASGANPWVQSTETNVDGLGPLVYCVEANNPTGPPPSTTDAKCEDGIAKALVKFVGAKGKCYQKCNDNLNKGKIPPGSCNPPAPSDMATAACISDPLKGAEAKSAAAIDKACPTFPSCAAFTSGTAWTGLVEGVLDGQTPQIYCASTTTTTTTSSSTTTTSTPPGPTLTITNVTGSSNCGGKGLSTPPSPPLSGEIDSDTAGTLKISDLGLGCLYIGGGNATTVPASLIPNGSSSIFTVSGTNLSANTGTGPANCTVGFGPGMHCIGGINTGAACSTDANCTPSTTGSCAPDANCFFGPPLPIPNAGLSTCVLNAIKTDASGTVTPSTGDAVISINLASRTVLTGNSTAPCPQCVAGTCNAGPNKGMACSPVGNLLTTLDCPPDPGGLLGALPVNLAPLVTGPSSVSAADGNFCPSQAHPGAFGKALTEAIKQTGSPGGNLSDGNPHAAVLGYSFCVPGTGSVAVDGSADIPGPGSVGLPVDMTLASPSGAFLTMP
jgi:hypothetical protein